MFNYIIYMIDKYLYDNIYNRQDKYNFRNDIFFFINFSLEPISFQDVHNQIFII